LSEKCLGEAKLNKKKNLLKENGENSFYDTYLPSGFLSTVSKEDKKVFIMVSKINILGGINNNKSVEINVTPINENFDKIKNTNRNLF
jgi:hypothetical protein